MSKVRKRYKRNGGEGELSTVAPAAQEKQYIGLLCFVLQRLSSTIETIDPVLPVEAQVNSHEHVSRKFSIFQSLV